MLVVVNGSRLVEVVDDADEGGRSMVHSDERMAPRASSVDGTGGKRVSMQRSRARRVQQDVQIGDVWVRRLSVHRPIRGCWYQNKRVGGRASRRRRQLGDEVTGHSDLRRSWRIAVRSGAARSNQKREGLASLGCSQRTAERSDEEGVMGSESVRDAKKTSVTPFGRASVSLLAAGEPGIRPFRLDGGWAGRRPGSFVVANLW